MKRACGLLLGVIVLAGCGADEPTAAEKRMNIRFDRLDYLMGNVEISAPPYQENLERLTRRYIALIHEYEDELGPEEIKNRLQQKSEELDDYCLPCAATVDRERDRY
jgi:hypothetical protein